MTAEPENPGSSSIAEDYFSPDEFPAQEYSRRSRRLTRRHSELIAETADGNWSPGRQALHYCLVQLATSGITESWSVGVVDGWADTESSFRVVYRFGTYPVTLGIRRVLEASDYDQLSQRPELFGPDVADFDIGEPLGTVAGKLRRIGDVHWWGDPDWALAFSSDYWDGGPECHRQLSRSLQP